MISAQSPASDPATGARDRQIALACLLLGALVRLVVAARTPLFPDEAYYWEWSRRLAGGYFDHPPAVAWLIAGGTAIAGDTPLGVRLGTLIVGALTTLVVAWIAGELGGAAAARRTALLFLCMPISMLGLAVATTDAPALLAVAVALLAVVRALRATTARARNAWWIAVGAALGAGLLAKLTVGVVGVAIAVALLTRPAGRRLLRGPAPWLGVAVALLIASPMLWWNAHHGWIEIRFQLAHGLGAPKHGSAIGRELALLGGQLALLSPIVLALLGVSAVSALRRTDEPAVDRDPAALLAAVALLVAGFFAYGALRKPTEANWPALALPAAVPLLAAAMPVIARRWWRPALAVGAAMVCLGLAQVAAPVLPLAARRDPVARAYGWSALAARAELERRTLRGGRWLAADRYQDAAELAYLTPDPLAVFALNIGGRPNQYNLWPTFADRARPGDALVVALDTGSVGRSTVDALAAHFARVDSLPRLALQRGADTVAMRQLWVLRDWRGTWPRLPERMVDARQPPATPPLNAAGRSSRSGRARPSCCHS